MARMKKVVSKSTVQMAEHGVRNKRNGDDEHGADGECGWKEGSGDKWRYRRL